METKELHAAKVLRGGRTARYMSYETSKVKLYTNDGALRYSFRMDSKGGGTTVVWLDIGPEDFAAILEAMIDADRQQAMATMSAELAEQTAAQPIHDERHVAEGRDSLLRLARKKYDDAPQGSDDAERFIWQSVTKLTKELEKPKVAGKTTSGSGTDAGIAQVH